MGKKHAIFTATDGGRASFVLDHWLASLQKNVNLTDIDVHVLGYGLSDAQQAELQTRGVECHTCVKDGQVGDIRIRDIASISSSRNYDQVLMVDSSDLIFQKDISPLFEQDKDQFRCVCEELSVPIHHVFMNLADFPVEVRRHVLAFLYDKPVVNIGFVLGPPSKFSLVWQTFRDLGVGYQYYCTDQLLMNYVFYRDGFRALDSKYNFVLVSMISPFTIREGFFYDAAGEVIPVVHNAGMKNFSRKIGNFGYGPTYNQKRPFASTFTRCLIHAGNVWKQVIYGLKRYNSGMAQAGMMDGENG
jgi:hypothetical protein